MKDDPGLTGVRVRKLIEPLGFRGSKSLASDFATEVSLFFDLILGGFRGPEPGGLNVRERQAARRAGGGIASRAVLAWFARGRQLG